jgi:hypothetical protein
MSFFPAFLAATFAADCPIDDIAADCLLSLLLLLLLLL